MSKIIFNRDVEVKGLPINGKINELNSTTMKFENSNILNTVPKQIAVNTVDNTNSKRYIDIDGPTSENIQYLQLDKTTTIPTSNAGTFNTVFYEDASSSYMFGFSTQSLYYSTLPGLAADTNNNNASTKREMYNLMQDISLIDASSLVVDQSYNTFVSLWGRPEFGTPSFSSWYISQNASIKLSTGAENFWAWGTHLIVWRYDLKNNTLISRSLASILRQIDPTNDVWKTATGGRGPVTSLGDGRFLINSVNPTISSVILYDKDLKGLANINLSSYGSVTIPDPKNISPTDYQARALYSFGINTDQINNITVKKWYPSDLNGITYKSLYTNETVNVFNNTDGLATFIYLNSSSQGQYDTVDKSSSFVTTGIMSPLASTKWNNSTGKCICYSLNRDNSDNLVFTPIRVYNTCPDNYEANDKLKIESFVQCPDKTTKEILKINYPLVDNRSSVIDLSGYEQFRPQAWNEGYNRFKFSDGSNNTLPISTGLQRFCVSIADISGVINTPATATLLANRGKCYYYQDIYATTYRRLLDSSNNVYYKQASLYNEPNDTGLLFTQLSDPSCAFYPGDGTIGGPTSRRYKNLDTNIWYYINSNGDYTVDGTTNGSQDPVENNFKLVRKEIINNGFVKRYMFTPYQLDGSLKTFNKDISSNLLNPRLPPFTANDNNRNPGQQLIYANFHFSNDHEFDSTQYYYSRPMPLKWEDTREYINSNGSYLYAYSFANARANPNKGQIKDISGEYVQEFFRLCQSAQGDLSGNHDVQVLLEGNDFYDLSSNPTGGMSNAEQVPSGHIVFKVKGSVLNCQPMVLQFTESMTNNLTLTEFMANQLNFYGAGIYNQNSLLKDDNDDYHMIIGSANGNYANISEMLYPAEYAARKVIVEMQKLLAGQPNELPISKETALALGFGNMNTTVQEPFAGTYSTTPGFKTVITDLSGSATRTPGILLETTLRGISDFLHRTSCYAANYYSDLSSNYMLANGNIVPVRNDVTNTNIWSYPLRDPLGTQAIFTGKQISECFDFVAYLHELRGRVFSARHKRFINNRSAVVNPKTMELEQIISHRFADTEVYHSFPREYYKVTVDSMQVDNGNNRDEINSVVTGGEYGALAGKTHIKVFNKSKLTGKKAKLISIDASRNNFACSYDGILGRQELGNEKYEYGNDAMFINYTSQASISGQTVYAGKYNNNDIYINKQPAQMNAESASNKIYFPIIPILDGVQYNGFENIRNIIKSEDGKAWILPRRPSDNHQSALETVSGQGITASNWQMHKSNMFTIIRGFTADNSGKLKLLWVTITNNHKPFDLINDNNPQYGGNNSGLQGISVVNDLCFVPVVGRELHVLNCQSGEVLQTFFGNDFDYDEIQKPYKTSALQLTQPDVVGFGSVQYVDGKLYIYSGYNRGGATVSAHSRKIFELSVKFNTKQSINLSKLDISGQTYSLVKSNLGNITKDVVFTEQDTISYNNNNFILITTFNTRDQYAKLIKGYKQIDAQYDALYHSGVTAIAISTTDKSFKRFSQSSKFSDKFVNGGSWYENTSIAYNDISSNILFLYAGQIPTRAYNQSPFYINKKQQIEAKTARNQKRLLTEYYRAKSLTGSTYPYPDNGSFVGKDIVTIHNNMRFLGYWNKTDNAITSATAYNPTFDRYNSTGGASGKSQLWHQPLEFTDVGGPNGLNSRLYPTPTSN